MEDEGINATPWEYALFIWDGEGPDDYRVVRFSHRRTWASLTANEYTSTLRELGDQGYELVTHQFLVRGQYNQNGRYGETIRELMTFKRPQDEPGAGE